MQHGVTLIKLDEAFKACSQRGTTDGIHPSKVGYDILRSAIITAFDKVR